MAMTEDERKAFVKELTDTLKTIGREAGAPHMQGSFAVVKGLLSRVLAMFENRAERQAREQPSGG